MKLITIFFSLILASLSAHTTVYESKTVYHDNHHWDDHHWHQDHWQNRVYYGDPWYHPNHVYFYGGDPYANFYSGYPYYAYDPAYYYYATPSAGVSINLNL